MNLNCGIYKITNLITNDFYIGQSINLKRREFSHWSKLRFNQHRNKYLQNSYNKYGKENFKFEVILICEPFELTRYEQGLVDKWKPIYNILRECVDSPKGTKHTKEELIKMSIIHKGIPKTEEHKRKIGEANKGNLSFLGHKHSEETKKKMSESAKKRSEETRLKQSMAHKGKVVSEETRLKLSKAHEGSHRTDEAKLKMSEWQKGRILPEETKLKMSIAKKKYWEERKQKERIVNE